MIIGSAMAPLERSVGDKEGRSSLMAGEKMSPYKERLGFQHKLGNDSNSFFFFFFQFLL